MDLSGHVGTLIRHVSDTRSLPSISPKRTFGQVSRLPSKRYRARYTDPDGALHSAPWTFETSGDAEAWLVDERRLISSGRWTPPKVRAEVAKRAEVDRRSRVFAR